MVLGFSSSGVSTLLFLDDIGGQMTASLILPVARLRRPIHREPFATEQRLGPPGHPRRSREIRSAALKCVSALPQKLLNALPTERFSNKAAKQKSAAVGRLLAPTSANAAAEQRRCSDPESFGAELGSGSARTGAPQAEHSRNVTARPSAGDLVSRKTTDTQ
jgi:hypothetical protein